jgi:hypothetical protein
MAVLRLFTAHPGQRTYRRKAVGKRFLLASVAAGVLLTLLNITGAAIFDPYTSGSLGYDFSYLQCGSSAPRASFGVVGVNGGYPFTYYNGCLASEFDAAAQTGNGALYVNTGYDPSYTAIDGRHTTSECATSSQSIAADASHQAAWAVGCSEAQRDLAYASSQSAGAATAWWLDVEESNSWSTSDLTLNQYTIEGLIATLRASLSVPVGIYSTAAQWAAITGAYQPAVDANWLATGRSTLRRASSRCGAAGFTGAPIWLVQYTTSYDHDYVC